MMTLEQFKSIKVNDFIFGIEKRRYIRELRCIGDITLYSTPNHIEKVFFDISENKLIRLKPDDLYFYFISQKEAYMKALELTKEGMEYQLKSDKEWINYLEDKLKDF